MGYYSKVVIAVNKEQYLKDSILTKNLPISVLKLADHHYNNDYGYFWVFDSWKWYQSYPEVKSVTSYINSLAGEELIINGSSPYCFIRVGEDIGDIDTQGDYHEFGLGVETIITGTEEAI